MSTITAALSKIRSSKKNTPKHKRRDNMPTTSSPKSSNQSQSSQISRKSLDTALSETYGKKVSSYIYIPIVIQQLNFLL